MNKIKAGDFRWGNNSNYFLSSAYVAVGPKDVEDVEDGDQPVPPQK